MLLRDETVRNFPTRFYDILATTKIPPSLKSLKVPLRQVDMVEIDGDETDEARDLFAQMMDAGLPAARRSLGDAKLFYAPGELAGKIYNSYPAAIIGTSLHLPFENIFIEFAKPLKGILEGGGELCYGVHLFQMDFQLEESDPHTVMSWWFRKFPDQGYWSTGAQIISLRRIARMTEKAVEFSTGKTSKGDLSPLLKLLSFILFMNSSNISYDLRQSPKMPRPKDKSWWRKEYESKFEELVVKDVSKRIALSLRRNETGVGWKHSAFVRGHFKVLSYCGVCGMKRAVLRFLRVEVCKCGSPLNPETAKTSTFWWEGHWAGPDIVDKIIRA